METQSKQEKWCIKKLKIEMCRWGVVAAGEAVETHFGKENKYFCLKISSCLHTYLVE